MTTWAEKATEIRRNLKDCLTNDKYLYKGDLNPLYVGTWDGEDRRDLALRPLGLKAGFVIEETSSGCSFTDGCGRDFKVYENSTKAITNLRGVCEDISKSPNLYALQDELDLWGDMYMDACLYLWMGLDETGRAMSICYQLQRCDTIGYAEGKSIIPNRKNVVMHYDFDSQTVRYRIKVGEYITFAEAVAYMQS